MKNGEKVLTQKNILVFAAVISLVALLVGIILPQAIKLGGISLPGVPPVQPLQPGGVTAEPTLPSEGETYSDQTFLSTPTATPVFFTPPIIGTHGVNLPNDFRVENWKNNSCETNSNPYFVEIYGVEIYGGVSSYNINFMDENKRFATFDVASTSEYFEFSPNVVVIPRNVYVQVVITFDINGGKSEWIDHVYYLNKNNCIED